MKKKGFTLVELLVVIAIIAMLLAILMPALGKVRALAYRLMCGTNLGGLGKAMAVYSNDYQEMYPVLGPTGSTWANGVPNYVAWDGGGKTAAPNPVFSTSATPTTSITSSLFLLVKYADVSTNQFVCKAAGEKKFELSAKSGDTQQYTDVTDITLCWDFGLTKTYSATTGAGPWNFVSYAYQFPYNPPSGSTTWVANQLSASSMAGMAVLADRNPWYKTGGLVTENTDRNVNTAPYLIPQTDLLPTSGNVNKTLLQKANSPNHQQEGQNILYMDSHVAFENRADVGIEQDNIYTPWAVAPSATTVTAYQKQGGEKPGAYGTATVGPKNNPGDSFLVN